MKSWFEMRAAADKAVAEILIYDEIGAHGVSAQAFLNALAALNAQEILVRINSPGGAVFDGLAIYNALNASKAKVTVQVDGIAASIASVIALAGSGMVMAANAFLMIHNPSVCACGTSEELRRNADALDKLTGSLVAVYRVKTGLSDAEIQALMAAETWFTAAEAKAKGFCDQILSEQAPQAPTAGFDLTRFRFRNPPQALARPAPPPRDPAPTETPLATETKPATTPTGVPSPSPAMVAKACLDAGVPEAAPALLAEATLTLDGLTKAVADAKEIKSICAKAGIGDQAAGLIAARATLDQARAIAFEALAAKDAASPTDGARHRPDGGGGQQPPQPPALNAQAIYQRFNKRG